MSFKESGYTSDQIEILTDDYLEDLLSEGLTGDNFLSAAAMARKSCNFFPKVADILKAHKEICSRPPENKANLYLDERPSYKTEKDREIGKRNIQTIKDMLAGKITKEQAEKRMVFSDS